MARAVYNAFLSYSHAGDHRLAVALESALRRFAKPLLHLRALRVFRDQTNLPLTTELWGEIERALSESDYLILLASPAAAQSPGVSAEVAHWLRLRGGHPTNLLLVLTDGRIQWNQQANDFDWTVTTALSHTLKGIYAREPLYADLTWAGTDTDLSLRNPRFQNEVASLAATIHGRPKDDLVGEDVRQRRRLRLVGAAFVAGLLLTTSVAVWQAVRAVSAQRQAEQSRDVARQEEAKALDSARREREARQVALQEEAKALEAARLEREARVAESKAREQAERRRLEAERQADIALSRQLVAQSESIRRQAVNVPLSALLAAQAIKRLESITSSSFEADQSMRQALALLPKPIADYPSGRLSPDGRYVVGRKQADWVVFDALSGTTLFTLPVRDDKAAFLFTLGGNWLAAVEQRTVTVYSLPAGQKTYAARIAPTPIPTKEQLLEGEPNEVVMDPALVRHDEPATLSADGRRLITISTSRWTVEDRETPSDITRERNTLVLWDLADGRMLRSTSIGGNVRFLTFHPDGHQITAVVLVVEYGQLHENTFSVTMDAESLERARTRATLVTGLQTLEWLRLILRRDEGPPTVLELGADRQPWNVAQLAIPSDALALDRSVVRYRLTDGGSVAAVTRTGNEVVVSDLKANRDRRIAIGAGE